MQGGARRVLWFVALYLLGLGVLGAIALLIRTSLGL